MKAWFNKECAQLLDQRKQAKMNLLQDPNQSNVNNLNNVRREASRHFRNKKKAYLKAKTDHLETNNMLKNTRDMYKGINKFKKGYQPTTKIVMDEVSDLFTGSHSI
jgi:hypothetical protein